MRFVARSSAALAALASVIFLGSGCDIISCGGIEDYWSNIAAEGLFLGVEDPDIAAELGAGAAATTFLARATSVNNVEENLLDDAERVWFGASGMSDVDLANEGSGLYLATSADDSNLSYVSGRSYVLSMLGGGDTSTATLVAPEPPMLSGVPNGLADPPQTHPAGQPMTVGLGGTYDNSIVIVVDEDGNLTYDTRPEGASEYMDWIGSGEDVSSVVIPGSAFPDAGRLYVLGIAGIDKAPDANFSGFNKLLSNLAMGAVTAEAVATTP